MDKHDQMDGYRDEVEESPWYVVFIFNTASLYLILIVYLYQILHLRVLQRQQCVRHCHQRKRHQMGIAMRT